MSQSITGTTFKANFAFSNQLENFTLPEMRIDKRNGINTYGLDNQYPQNLWDMFNNSGLHRSIILRKRDEIVANGLYSSDPKVTAWLNNCNDKGQSFQDVFSKLVLSQLVYGGFALQMIFNKTGNDLGGLFNVDLKRLRYTTNADKFLYARDWRLQRVKPIKDIEVYKGQTTGSSIYYNCGDLTDDLYPIPEFVGALADIQNSVESSTYNLAQLQNGFFPSFLITLKNGNPTEDEKRRIMLDFKRDMQGSGAAGKLFIDFCENAQEPNMVITPIQQPNLDGRYLTMQNTVRDNIFIAHRVTNTAIFGVMTPSGLGQQISPADSLELFRNGYVVPTQLSLLRTINNLLSVKFPNIDLKIKPLKYIGSYFKDEILISSIMTVSEIRENIQDAGWIENAAIPAGEKLRIDDSPVTTVDTTDKELEKPPMEPNVDNTNNATKTV